MKMYFSGIASESEAEWLQQAGIHDYLSDPTDSRHVPANAKNFALDSGAYRAFKKGQPITADTIPQWFDAIQDTISDMDNRKVDFITMPDVLGDPDATMHNWEVCEELIRQQFSDARYWVEDIVPVWQWGSPKKTLRYFDSHIFGFRTIAIGGCVPWMRDKNEDNLMELADICRTYGSKLHILGCNWLKAIELLDPLVKSCDTSKWLDGARYGQAIQQIDGHLRSVEKRSCGMSMATREELCVLCATTLNSYCNHGVRTEQKPRNVGRKYVLKTYSGNGPTKKPSLMEMAMKIENEKRHAENKERFMLELEHRKH
jgi:hypothetical protein